MAHKKLQLHDRFTRASMTNTKVFEEFFKSHLPEKIKNMIDFSSMKLCKETFVGDILTFQCVDLLYETKFDGKPGFLYILVEHASKPDPLLSFRMLKYMMAIMEEHLKTTKARKLPLIYPLVFYTGKRPYKQSMNFFDLFPSEEQEFAKEIFTSPCQLIDLTQFADEKLRKDLWYGTMALSLKHVHDFDIVPFVKGIIENLKKLEASGEESYITSIVIYLMSAGKTENIKDFYTALSPLETIEQEEIMTIVESLIDQLEPRIYEKGKRQGREEGKHERDLEIARDMLAKGFDPQLIASITGVSFEDQKNLVA